MVDLTPGTGHGQTPSWVFSASGTPGRTRLRRSGFRRREAVALIALLILACSVGALAALVNDLRLLALMAACVLAAAVATRPQLGAYVLIAVTPLVAGIDRGLVIPVLRPNEALLLIVAAGLTARGIVRFATGARPRMTFDVTDRTILLLAFAGSLLPLAWLLLRGQALAQDDLLYALIPWKYYAVYVVVLVSVRDERQVRRCLWIAMMAASVVAILAILQSVQLAGVTRILATYYKPYGNAEALLNNRGGSTLSLPIAAADLMIFNLAIAIGFLVRGHRRRILLLVLGCLFVLGVVASGEFSAAIGLLFAVIVIGLVTGKMRPLAGLLPAFVAAGIALRPVIDRRLSGFQSASGHPVSWIGRLHNLENYFWPVLFSHGNFLLGVRPAARVATPSMATGYIWIESGYTWLLWSGGIPFLLAFVYFVWANVRRNLRAARERIDAYGVASLAVVVGLIVVAGLMVLDPHLTYRGSADLLFTLLALSTTGLRGARKVDAPVERHPIG